MFIKQYGHKRHLSLIAITTLLLLYTCNWPVAGSSPHLSLAVGANHLATSSSPFTYLAALSFDYHLHSGCLNEIGLLAKNDNLSLQIVAQTTYPLLQLNKLAVSARLQGSIGAGLSNDIWYYRSLAAGIQVDLATNNSLVSSWVVQGKKESSAWRFNQLNVPFRTYGVRVAPAVESKGLAITLTASDSPAPPEIGTTARMWSVTAGYRFTL